MIKKIKKLISLVVFAGLLFGMSYSFSDNVRTKTADAVSSVTNAPIFKRSGNNWIPLKSNYELGSTSSRIAKVWMTNADISGAFTLSGTVGTGGINMNNELITNIGNAGTDFTSAGGLTLADYLSVTRTGAGILETQIRHINSSNTVGTGSRISFRMLDSASAIQTYGRISTEIDVNTDTSEDGTMRMSVFENGSATDYLVLNGNTGAVTINKPVSVSGDVAIGGVTLKTGMLGTINWDNITTVQGTWVNNDDVSNTDWDDIWVPQAGTRYNATATNGDEIKVSSMILNAGTYEIKVVTNKDLSAGILEVLHGASSIGTSDLYNVGILYNNISTFTYTPTTRVTGDLRFKVNGKNASSSNYYCVISRIQIMKTD